MCEVWICVDAAGDYAVGKEESEACDAYEQTIGELVNCGGYRLVKLIVNVPLPDVVELQGAAPAQGAAKLTVVD